MKTKLFFTYVLFSLLASISWAQNFNGTYTYEGGNATLQLSLQQNNGKITGSLSSSTGSVFQIQGDIQENVAMGYCGNQDGTSFFEAFMEGNQLTFGLIEADANNQPNYDKAQYIQFVKSTGSSTVKTQNTSSKNSQTQTQAQTHTPVKSSQNLQAKKGTAQIAENEVGDPSWGFKLIPPTSWVHQQTNENIILGHNSIAGMILVFPHQSESMQTMQAEIQEGIQENDAVLNVIQGSVKSAGNQILTAEYSGNVQGSAVKARGFGVLSPYGGGAYVLAVTTPEMMGNDLIKAAEQTVKNVTFFKSNVDKGLVELFVGRWTTTTKNTSTSFCLCEDGRFVENYESSYSGTDAGATGGVWGNANESQSSGRWTIKGNKMEGQFIITMQNGETIVYNFVRNGNRLNELYIGNSLYSR